MTIFVRICPFLTRSEWKIARDIHTMEVRHFDRHVEGWAAWHDVIALTSVRAKFSFLAWMENGSLHCRRLFQ